MRVTIVDSLNKSKDQLYIAVNDWFIRSFINGRSIIQLNDKEAGVIIGKGYVRNVAEHVLFASSANVSAWIIIRVDLKDNKMKITTTIQKYDMKIGTGVIGAMNTGLNGTPDSKDFERWLPQNYFPFVKRSSYKRTAAKAFVNCHIYSLVLADKLAEAATNGITGTEDNW
ncbi:MAG: DUF4468 domain-containing protein [Bacteroidaceae bacterium]|nr:DUF4468 domain-containing protein [Bacteroidaceae bacterium]